MPSKLKEPSFPSPPAGGKARATYEALLVAGGRVLAERGLPALTSTTVAAEAGVATGTFYSYFTDKDELLAALFARGLDEIHESVAAVLTTDALLDRGLRDTLADVVATVLDGYRRHSPVIRAALGRIPDSAPLRTIYWDRYGRSAESAATFLRRGMRAGLVRQGDAEALAHTLLVMVQGLNHPVLLAGDGRRSAAVARNITDALYGALGKTPQA